MKKQRCHFCSKEGVPSDHKRGSLGSVMKLDFGRGWVCFPPCAEYAAQETAREASRRPAGFNELAFGKAQRWGKEHRRAWKKERT